MRIRTLLLVLVLLGTTLGAAILFDVNREVLSAEFRFTDDASLSVGLVIVLSLLSGALVVLLVGLAREIGHSIERRRDRRLNRKQEEIEERYSRGLVAVLEGRDERALQHFRAVLEQDSRHFNTLLKLGEVLRIQGRYAEAIEFHRKAHHLKEEDTRPLYALVDDYEAMDDLDRARIVLGKIIGINKQSMSAWRRIRSLHVKDRNWTAALEANDQVEKLVRGDDVRGAADRRFGIGIRYEIAAQHLREGRPKEAIAILRKLLKQDSSIIPAHVTLGEALVSQGQEADAVQTWHQAFELTGSPIFLTVLEEHYLGQERPLQAIEALKRCIGRARKDTLPRFYLGKLYFRLEMLDDALAVLSSLEGRASYAPTLHYLLGRIHDRRRNHREAAAQYRKVIKEMDLVQLEYRCRACEDTVLEWTPRCEACGEWNSIEVNFREEISPEELGLSPAPMYGSGRREHSV
jgi:lipopolysaccharide biosynthesis regulator YciM